MKCYLLALLPFLCFCCGYAFIAKYMGNTHVVIPDVEGVSLVEALKSLSDCQLFGEVIAENEHADIAEGTVLEQTPPAGVHTRARQAVGLIIVKKVAQMRAPEWIIRELEAIRTQSHELGVRIKEHTLPGIDCPGICYAQFPVPGAGLTDGTVHIYTMQATADFRLVPSLIGMSVRTARLLMEERGVSLEILHSQYDHGDDQVSEEVAHQIISQNPAPGEVINRYKLRKIYVQL